uniref:Uncharacterized protein n=1 Tax=Trichogramma kaykai TaxID=54128 RepID=A0ABD2VXE4_9HYME
MSLRAAHKGTTIHYGDQLEQSEKKRERFSIADIALHEIEEDTRDPFSVLMRHVLRTGDEHGDEGQGQQRRIDRNCCDDMTRFNNSGSSSLNEQKDQQCLSQVRASLMI